MNGRDTLIHAMSSPPETSPPEASPPDLLLARFAPHAVRISTHKRQKIAVAGESDETLYVIGKGIFLARASIPNARHQILSILYPGDCARSTAIPPLDDAEIATATETGEIWRIRWTAAKQILDRDPDLARRLSDRLANQSARLALHNAIIAGLTGEERVAALMTELSLRTGKQTPAGLVFDMPLSRTDIAEHLALNADTVSRIVSRMRAKSLIAFAGRNRLVCRDAGMLAAECPLADTLARMHGAAGHGPLPQFP